MPILEREEKERERERRRRRGRRRKKIIDTADRERRVVDLFLS